MAAAAQVAQAATIAVVPAAPRAAVVVAVVVVARAVPVVPVAAVAQVVPAAVLAAQDVAVLVMVAVVVAHKIGAFFTECLRLTDNYPAELACPEIVRLLPSLLLDPTTAPAITQVGRNTLFERVGGLTILGHYHPESVWSGPHDHGRTWAIYAVVTGRTAMYEYQSIGEGKVKLVNSYWIVPGQACWYPVGAIHSHKTYEDARLIRIEGLNIWRKANKPGGRRYQMVVK